MSYQLEETTVTLASEFARAMLTNPNIDPVNVSPTLFAERSYMLASELIYVITRNLELSDPDETH